jgi:hypothetical protein
MYRKLAIAPILSVVVLIASLPTEADEPSLSETLGWMDSTYNPHESSPGHGKWETYIPDGKVFHIFQRRTTHFTYDGCSLSFTTQGGLLVKNYQDTASHKFNLGDIDPGSTHTTAYDSRLAATSCEAFPNTDMVCDIAEMTFQTRNQALVIDADYHFVYPELQGSDHDSYSKSKTYEAAIPLDDVNYAARFEKAFRHAVVLCGGKPSAF